MTLFLALVDCFENYLELEEFESTKTKLNYAKSVQNFLIALDSVKYPLAMIDPETSERVWGCFDLVHEKVMGTDLPDTVWSSTGLNRFRIQKYLQLGEQRNEVEIVDDFKITIETLRSYISEHFSLEELLDCGAEKKG